MEQQVNPVYFFRINRSTIINKQHVEKIERYTKNSLAIKIKAGKNYLKTSQSHTSSFREWIEK
ncbi:LytTR family DNA-binding domain-containing protein [Bizionia myxarmorum]|uniref:LytTR family transcriptional regulator n=1 Tax=Bizionia myxarmorum TaxID=291186 RepID=A0A5D0QZB6_9FLAO|nr:LytTR family transcriptional regulator [Bizionia myxarmorum]